MPAGGFGNLIALPLQHARRAQGCTVFLDESMQPHTDQWAYLAGVSGLDGDRAELLAHDAERTGATLLLAHWADGAAAAPVRRLPCALVSRRP